MLDWSKVAKKAKGKGDRGERRIASLLMEFTKKNFRRTPSSGGYNKQGGVQIANHKFCGDVICDDPSFSFCIESKNRPDDFSLAALTTSPNGSPFTEWWYQTLNDARLVNLLPLLYFKLGRATNNVVKNDYIAVTWPIAQHIGFPESAPHVKLFIYNGPVEIYIKEKVKGQAKKVRKPILVRLPEPVLISWMKVIEFCDPNKFFELPSMVDTGFEVLGRRNEDGVLREQ